MTELAKSIRTLRALGICDEVLGPALVDAFMLEELISLRGIINRQIEKSFQNNIDQIIDRKLFIINDKKPSSFMKSFNKGREFYYRRYKIAHCPGRRKRDCQVYVDDLKKNKKLLDWIGNIIIKHDYEYFVFYGGPKFRDRYETICHNIYGLKLETKKQREQRFKKMGIKDESV